PAPAACLAAAGGAAVFVPVAVVVAPPPPPCCPADTSVTSTSTILNQSSSPLPQSSWSPCWCVLSLVLLTPPPAASVARLFAGLTLGWHKEMFPSSPPALVDCCGRVENPEEHFSLLAARSQP
ncbi:unnamed protein product, partial [Ectocarpus sp. 4 AP-2014]